MGSLLAASNASVADFYGLSYHPAPLRWRRFASRLPVRLRTTQRRNRHAA
jgi:hypothetical protein